MGNKKLTKDQKFIKLGLRMRKLMWDIELVRWSGIGGSKSTEMRTKILVNYNFNLELTLNLSYLIPQSSLTNNKQINI